LIKGYIDEEKDKKKKTKLQFLADEIMLAFLYPRLDAAVSTTINHLLKGPFCIHPKSRKIYFLIIKS
jgi:DNA primase small subunit